MMRSWYLAFAVVAAGCGRVGFDRAGHDGPPATSDGPALGTGPFGAPVRVDELSSSSREDDITLTADLLECMFSSDRPGSASTDLWTATRASLAAPWSQPVQIAALESSDLDLTPELAGDGLTLWFTSDRPGGVGGADIYVVTRASRLEPWGTPSLVPELDSGSNEYSPAVDSTGLTITFTSDRGGDYDLYVASRADLSATWGAPQPIAAVDTTAFEGDGFFAADGLYFDSDRAGGTGKDDLYGPSTAGPVELAELDSTSDDQDPWLSPDLHVIFFASTRAGSYDIYQASR